MDHTERGQILGALWLLELRARWADARRPSAITPARWHAQLHAAQPGLPSSDFDAWKHLTDWALYAPSSHDATSARFTTGEVRGLCFRVIKAWPVQKLRAERRLMTQPEVTRR